VAQAMQAYPSVINYLHNYQQSFTQSVTPGSNYLLALTGLAGAKAAQLVVFVQPAANTNSYTSGNLRTYLPLGGPGAGDASTTSTGYIDLRIAAGTSIISGGANTPAYFLRARQPHMTGTPGYMTANVPGVYPLQMSDNNGDVYDNTGSPGFYREANWEGGYTIQNSDQLYIQFGSNFNGGTTASMTIGILAMTLASVQQLKGQFTQLC